MDRHIMVMFSAPVEGQDDEYNKWYTDTHLPEVVQAEGFIAAQRFVLANPDEADAVPHPYLAIYEIEGSIDAAKEALAAGRATRSPVTPAFGGAVSVWFTAISDRVTAED